MDTKIVELMRNGGGDMGMGGMNPIWAIVLLAFLRGGFGIGGEGAGNAAYTGMEAASSARFTGIEAQLTSMQNSMSTNAVVGKLDGIGSAIASGFSGVGNAICDSTFALNNSINNGFFWVQNSIKDLGFTMQQGFCTTNYNIQNQTQAILNQMATDRYADLQTRNCELNAKLALCENEKYTNAVVSAGNANVIRHVEYLLAGKTVTPTPAT